MTEVLPPIRDDHLVPRVRASRSRSAAHTSATPNPCSKAALKTLRCCPAFPEWFGSISDAQTFCETCFAYYNHEHRHSGIGLHTAASVPDGTAVEIRAQRTATLDAAYAANPTRFTRRPTPPKLRLDQQTAPRGGCTERMNNTCLTRRDSFRSTWLQQVETCRAPFADGEARDPAGYFEPLHSLTLQGCGPAVTLDEQPVGDEDAVLHLHAEDISTPGQARALAVALLQAADPLEAVQPPR